MTEPRQEATCVYANLFGLYLEVRGALRPFYKSVAECVERRAGY